MKKYYVLLAEDDPDDRFLIEKALKSRHSDVVLTMVNDGVELMEYLRGGARSERPDLILLDLNMPRKNGHQVLAELKEDAELRKIPVVIFSTSSDSADVSASYDGGSNAYVTKPKDFSNLHETLSRLEGFWFRTAQLARRDD